MSKMSKEKIIDKYNNLANNINDIINNTEYCAFCDNINYMDGREPTIREYIQFLEEMLNDTEKKLQELLEKNNQRDI